MTTLVGTQKDFAIALKELIGLDYDAVEAYKAAIDRIKNEDCKNQLQKFKQDHERHIEELNNILILHKEEPVTLHLA